MVNKRRNKDLSNRVVFMAILLVVLVSVASIGVYYNFLNNYNSNLSDGENIFNNDNQINGKVSIQIVKNEGKTISDENVNLNQNFEG
jgi:hypothetical protein